MKITEKLLSRIEIEYGFNRKNLAKLGVSWPPKKGWRQRILGNEIPDSYFQEAKHDFFG